MACRISGTIATAATSHTRKANTVKHRRYAPATPAWQQYLRQLHQLGSRICAGFISLAAEFAPASSAWQQNLRQLHQLGGSICASFISLAAALAPALPAWQLHLPCFRSLLIPPLLQISREGGRRKIIMILTASSTGEEHADGFSIAKAVATSFRPRAQAGEPRRVLQ